MAMRADFGRAGVLMGGDSTEREISIKSGQAVLSTLKEEGLDALGLDIKTHSLSENKRLIKKSGIDIAFIALHGYFGEDGQIQNILEGLGIPYTGSGVRASRLAMDKIASRRIFQTHGLAVPRYKVIHRASYHKDSISLGNAFGFPLVVKPSRQGSSIGLSIIDNKKRLDRAIELAFSLDERAIIEEYLEGREITVGIIGDMPLPVIEIKPGNRFFDFQAKYTTGITDYIVPAKIKEKASRQAKSCALLAHKFLGCQGLSRADMILKDNRLYLLEVNSIPGLTQNSLLPKAAKAAGISFNKLCLRLLELAYEKKKV